MGKVSIVTPFCNGREYFKETFDCVLAQSYQSWEWVIIDDGSSLDQFEWLVELVSGESRITVIRSDNNLGAGVARNAGVDVASGEYLTFIDSDDCWEPHFLESFVKISQNYSNCAFYGGYLLCNSEGKVLSQVIPTADHNQMNILAGCQMSLTSIFIKKQCKDIVARFGDIRKRNDLVFFYYLLGEMPVHKVNCIMSHYRVRRDSLSRNKLSLFWYQWVVCRKVAGLSIIKSSTSTLLWAMKGFLKYLKISGTKK